MGSRISDFRRKLALGSYELTGHAKEEMEQDAFTIEDVKSAVNSARIIATQKHGRGRRKYVLQGRSADGRDMGVVCRTMESGRLRVITVFEVRG